MRVTRFAIVVLLVISLAAVARWAGANERPANAGPVISSVSGR